MNQPKLDTLGWLRWFWRQLTSMRTALVLLLLLAIAAIPGSLVPQRSSDPNGVTQYFADHEDIAPLLDKLQLFDVYSSVWFSAIYILLFISLIGCVLPRTKHHWDALRSRPPRTPVNLDRLPGFRSHQLTGVSPEHAINQSAVVLKKLGYRIERYERKGKPTVSAERGYARETGNLIFHFSLVGVLIAVGLGGGFSYAGQRVIVEGQAFSNTLLAYDSFNPGRFFNDSSLTPYTIQLDKFTTTYEEQNVNAIGQPTNFVANVTTQLRGQAPEQQVLRVNEPLSIGGSSVYLLGNGYAPSITVRNAAGDVVFTDIVPFLPQDKNLTSVGVVKLPDGLDEQLGLIGFFYPTVSEGHKGAFFSSYPDLLDPMVTFNVYVGDLGLDEGIPRSVYALDTSKLTQVTGGKTGVKSLEMRPGESADLPNGLGSVTFDGVKKFASLDVRYDPTQGWVLIFSMLALAGLLLSLFIPRRRMWVAVSAASGRGKTQKITIEYAGLARGDDPTLEQAVTDLSTTIERDLGLNS